MSATGIGVICGIIFGLIISAIIFVICNKNGKMKTNYDERQEAIRGRGYKYAFYASYIYFVIWIVLEMGEIHIPAVTPIIVFGGIVVGILTLGIYTVFKNAYWGTNNDPVKYIVVLGIVTVINLAAGITSAMQGELVVDGVLQFQGLNILCGAMMLCLAVALLIKKFIVKEEE